ncbi:MAG: hypothetical protein Q9159_003796 [Coniocarpon cinnabarinum]
MKSLKKISLSRKPADPVTAASDTLKKANVPSCVWMEHALQRNNVGTDTTDLFLLVPDVEQAASVLSSAGWKKLGCNDSFKQCAPLHGKHRFMDPKSPDVPPVTLLSANDWFYTMPKSARECSPIPPLDKLLDGLMSAYMDSDDPELRMHLSSLLHYPYVFDTKARHAGFEEGLKVENRQLHYDLLVGWDQNVMLSTESAHRHHKQLRDEIRAGRKKPQKRNKATVPLSDEVYERL